MTRPSLGLGRASWLLALVPALIAVYIFHATCSMRSPKAEARMREANKLGDRTPPPPNYGRVA